MQKFSHNRRCQERRHQVWGHFNTNIAPVCHTAWLDAELARASSAKKVAVRPKWS